MSRNRRSTVVSRDARTARRSGNRSARKYAILVLGMHRSGTSAVTRILNLLGAELPTDLMPPRDDNELGFWESSELKSIHDKLLAHVDSSWDDPGPLPSGWLESPSVADFREEIGSFLERSFGHARLAVIKDPRICRFVPLWIDALQECGTEPVAVLTIRNPLEVAASLKLRNQITPSHSGLASV